MKVSIVEGDLLDLNVDAIVNSWNRNIIPWWLLIPHGVSGAIKREAGLEPFRELGRRGPIPLGGAVATSAGMLHFRAIIHVAGINIFWRATRHSIQTSVRSAMKLAAELEIQSLGFPIIGAGAGGFDPKLAERLILEVLDELESPVTVTLVRWRRHARNEPAIRATTDQ